MTNMNLLEKFVNLMIEKTRRTVNAKTGKVNGPFIWKHFLSLKQPRSRVLYARMHLKPFGVGSSRAVFLINAKKVLKIATNEAGFEQNRIETTIASDPDIQPIVAKVFQSDPKFRWVVSELVRELKTAKDFEDLTGVPLVGFEDEFEQLTGTPFSHFEKMTGNEALPDEDPMTGDSEMRREAMLQHPIILAAFELATNYDLAMSDFGRIDHWGKTPDGRAVLLDYGYTVDIANRFYENEPDTVKDSVA